MKHLVCVYAVGVCVLGAAPSIGQSDYAVIDLGSLGGSSTSAMAVNELGVVSGTSASSFGNRAFVWRNGLMESRDPLTGSSYGEGLNDLGEVAGYHGIFFNENAGLWRADETLTNIGRLGDPRAWARDVNNASMVVGSSHFDEGPIRGYVWSKGEFTILPSMTPEHLGSGATRINELGQVLGGGSYDPDGRGGAILWNNGIPTAIGVLEEGRQSWPGGINNNSQVVGYANANGQYHAFFWEAGEIIDIHQPNAPAWHTYANAINDNEVIVGTLDRYGDGSFIRACIWLNDELRELDGYTPTNSRWTLIEARDINNAGQIVGNGEYRGQSGHAYMLSPVTPTMVMAAPTPGRANAMNTLSVTGATPGKKVYFVYGTHGGGAIVPDCDLQTGAAVQIEKPKVVGSAIADANGEASLLQFVPGAARNQGDILIQAVELNGCKVSQLVVEAFE